MTDYMYTSRIKEALWLWKLRLINWKLILKVNCRWKVDSSLTSSEWYFTITVTTNQFVIWKVCKVFKTLYVYLPKSLYVDIVVNFVYLIALLWYTLTFNILYINCLLYNDENKNLDKTINKLFVMFPFKHIMIFHFSSFSKQDMKILLT